MTYANYDSMIMSEDDIEKYKQLFEADIEETIKRKRKELADFIERAEKRVSYINEHMLNKDYRILGRTYKEGNKKCILFIIQFPSGLQISERYESNYVSDIRKKLSELKQKYCDVDWSRFEEEIR